MYITEKKLAAMQEDLEDIHEDFWFEKACPFAEKVSDFVDACKDNYVRLEEPYIVAYVEDRYCEDAEDEAVYITALSTRNSIDSSVSFLCVPVHAGYINPELLDPDKVPIEDCGKVDEQNNYIEVSRFINHEARWEIWHDLRFGIGVLYAVAERLINMPAEKFTPRKEDKNAR